MNECFRVPGETWLCEAYAQQIKALAGDKVNLPLDEEKSRQVYERWDRGNKTELYGVVEGI